MTDFVGSNHSKRLLRPPTGFKLGHICLVNNAIWYFKWTIIAKIVCPLSDNRMLQAPFCTKNQFNWVDYVHMGEISIYNMTKAGENKLF